MSIAPPCVQDLPLRALRRMVLASPADRAAEILAVEYGHILGAQAVEVRLCDRAMRALHVVGSTDGRVVDGAHETWPIRGGVAGDAVLSRRVVREERGGVARVHVPLVVRGNAHGTLTVEGMADDVADSVLVDLAEFAALLVAEAGEVTDFYEVHRRSWSYSISAEFQWQLLPGTSVDDGQVELHALVEPAPQVTSDLFDWSIDRSQVRFAVLDAEGRNLSAALPAALAVAALRHARRADLPLEEQVALVDQAVYDQYRGAGPVHALLVGLDLDTGAVQAVRAGDSDAAPRAFRRRDGAVEEVAFARQEALGRFDRSPFVVETVDLRPDDELFVVSDGGIGARDASGEPFGTARLLRHLTGGTGPLAGGPRRLLDVLREYSGGELTQDATVLALGWRGDAQPTSGAGAGSPASVKARRPTRRA